MKTSFQVTVNGDRRSVQSEPDRPLLEVLREDLGLTGTKYGCGEGQCRACSVLLDGTPVQSCLTPISSAAGATILTIEGLARRDGDSDGGAERADNDNHNDNGDRLHPVQAAFVEERAMQCGYCVPGMIMSALALIERNPNPDDEAIRSGMNGNLCRCCGYSNILRAVRSAARKMRETRSERASDRTQTGEVK